MNLSCTVSVATACLLAPIVEASTDDAAPVDPASATIAVRMDRTIRAYHDRGEFDGSVLAIRDGEVVYAGGFGPANRTWDIPNTERTKFDICSVTKQFTAVLVLQLVGEGRVELDASINTYLPWYRTDNGARITVRHLLQHTSGVPEPITKFDELDDALDVIAEPRALIEQFASGDLLFEPGTAFSYSNGDYFILGAIIEACTDQSYAAVLQQKILDPLEMTDTGVRAFETVVPAIATGYTRVGETFEHRLHFNQLGYAAAGMYSTVVDMGKWNRALLDHTILSAELTDLMFTPAVLGGNTGNYVALGSWVYTRPLPPDNTKAPRIVERRGFIMPFTALTVLCPDDRHAFVILSNHEPCPIDTLPYAAGLPLDLLTLLYE